MKFILLINVKMPTIVGILTFICMINTTSERLKARNFIICRYFSFYKQLKFCAQLSWAWKKFYNLGSNICFLIGQSIKVAYIATNMYLDQTAPLGAWSGFILLTLNTCSRCIKQTSFSRQKYLQATIIIRLIHSLSCSCWFLLTFQNYLFQKYLPRIISVSNSLDPDQNRHYVCPDLCSNCL